MRLTFMQPALYLLGVALAFVSLWAAVLIFLLTPLLLVKPLKLRTQSPDRDDLEV